MTERKGDGGEETSGSGAVHLLSELEQVTFSLVSFSPIRQPGSGLHEALSAFELCDSLLVASEPGLIRVFTEFKPSLCDSQLPHVFIPEIGIPFPPLA